MRYKTITDTLEHIECYANGVDNGKIVAIHIENEKSKIYKALIEYTEKKYN